MEWERLLSSERMRDIATNHEKENRDLRSAFEIDYHRIIGSASFRRLQDKTQVFPLDKSDFIRTRLTHSLEVSSFAKALGQNVAEHLLEHPEQYPGFKKEMKEDMCDILQSAGLIHDIGNPPFGHFGETAIREWFVRNIPNLTWNRKKLTSVFSPQMLKDFYNFEGNAQALRLVTKLHYLADENGMNLTYALLDTIIKYPNSSMKVNPDSPDIKDKKMGYFLADEDVYHQIKAVTGTEGKRHPLTYILEAADDMAYKTADIEDAYKKRCFTLNQLFRELKEYGVSEGAKKNGYDPLADLRYQYDVGVENKVSDPEMYAVQNWVVRVQDYLLDCATDGFISHYGSIMQGNYPHDLYKDTPCEKLMFALGDIAYRYAFTTAPIYRLEVGAGTVLNDLLERFVNAAIHYDNGEQLGTIDEKLMAIISDNYIHAYHHYSEGKSDVEKLYLRLMLVTDSVCGMTDSYAKELYQEFNGWI